MAPVFRGIGFGRVCDCLTQRNVRVSSAFGYDVAEEAGECGHDRFRTVYLDVVSSILDDGQATVGKLVAELARSGLTQHIALCAAEDQRRAGDFSRIGPRPRRQAEPAGVELVAPAAIGFLFYRMACN